MNASDPMQRRPEKPQADGLFTVGEDLGPLNPGRISREAQFRERTEQAILACIARVLGVHPGERAGTIPAAVAAAVEAIAQAVRV